MKVLGPNHVHNKGSGYQYAGAEVKSKPAIYTCKNVSINPQGQRSRVGKFFKIFMNCHDTWSYKTF